MPQELHSDNAQSVTFSHYLAVLGPFGHGYGYRRGYTYGRTPFGETVSVQSGESE